MEQVSANTRISLKNLQAIEANDLTKISSAFFYKSFVRQFADAVGISYEGELSALVQQTAATMPEPLMPGQGDAPLPRVNALRPPRPKRFRWLYSVASLVVMVVACSALYAMWEQSKSNLGGAFASLVQSVGSKTAKTAAQPAASAPPAPTETATATAPPSSEGSPEQKDAEDNGNTAVPSPDGDSYRIELSATERTWLSVTTDGKPAYTGILQADESKVVEGHDSARLRTGNAGGISVVFNGKAIGSLGARGQVRTIVFTKNRYEIVEPGSPLGLSDFNPIAELVPPAVR